MVVLGIKYVYVVRGVVVTSMLVYKGSVRVDVVVVSLVVVVVVVVNVVEFDECCCWRSGFVVSSGWLYLYPW